MESDKVIIACSFCDKHIDGSCFKDRLHGYESWCSLECVISDRDRDNLRRIESLLDTINNLLKVFKNQQQLIYPKCKDCDQYYMILKEQHGVD